MGHTRSLCTAIIHLRDPVLPNPQAVCEPILRAIRGVNAVSYEPKDSLLTVLFDAEQAGIAEIVRIIEACGPSVAGVAERPGSTPIRV